MDKYKLTKKACYLTGATMAISANLSPILFLTFRDMYNLSFTLLGFLVVINFFTQLLIDLVFTFFTKYFNIHKTVKVTPFIVFVGLILYAVLPRLFPQMAFFTASSGRTAVMDALIIASAWERSTESIILSPFRKRQGG